VKLDRKSLALVSALLALCLIIAQGIGNRAQFNRSRRLALPEEVILDKNCLPIIASSGKVGFISSATDGSLIAFSTVSGRVLSQYSAGETAGQPSMVELGRRRLIALPCANDPDHNRPATVSIIDVTSAKRPTLIALIELPLTAHITPQTRALLTSDGRLGIIASSFDQPELFSFSVETGQVISRLVLGGRPSEIALDESQSGSTRLIAITSAAVGALFIIELDEQGGLSHTASFSPNKFLPGASFEESNNPVFSADGQTIYVAAANGERLFAVSAKSGAEIDSITTGPNPQRVVVAKDRSGGEIIGVIRLRRRADEPPGGVTIIANRDGRLVLKSEFTPPEPIQLSDANNVAFDPSGSVAFIGSKNGILFAFSAETGELESNQMIGGELLGLAISGPMQTVAVVRRAARSDEIVLIGFELTDSDSAAGHTYPDAPPTIKSISPETIEQGQQSDLTIKVHGSNFTPGSSLIASGTEVAAELVSNGKVLVAKLPGSLTAREGDISIQVKGSSGALSLPATMHVVRPGAPIIEAIDIIGRNRQSLKLRIKGKNFRPSSTIFIAGNPLNTQHRLSATHAGTPELRAQLPKRDIAAKLRVQVRDSAAAGLASSEAVVSVFGPRVVRVEPSVIALGARNAVLKIYGANFRPGAEVLINDRPVSNARRLSSTLISSGVPRELARLSVRGCAGKLDIVVRNPDGSTSRAKQVNVRAPAECDTPQITGFGVSKLFAGSASARVSIRGRNFRRGARVILARVDEASQLEPDRSSATLTARFRSNRLITITLSKQLRGFIEQPGLLKFQVVNANSGDVLDKCDAVPASAVLRVVAPEIDRIRIKGNGKANARLLIVGANFRAGALVEFIKAGAVLLRKTPASITSNLISVKVPAKKFAAIGNFQVRVTGPGNISSNTMAVGPEAIARKQPF
jgi:hypothetical protein